MFQRLIIQIACLLFIGTSLLGQGKTWPHCKNPDGSIAVGAVMVQTGTTPSPWVCAVCDEDSGTYHSVGSGADLGIPCTAPTSVVTDENPDGQVIATHDDGNGTVININETVTTLVDNGDGTYTYTSEDGTVTTLTAGTDVNEIVNNGDGTKTITHTSVDGTVTTWCVPTCNTTIASETGETFELESTCSTQVFDISTNDIPCETRDEDGNLISSGNGIYQLKSISQPNNAQFTPTGDGKVYVTPTNCSEPFVTDIETCIVCPDGTKSNTAKDVFIFVPPPIGSPRIDKINDAEGNQVETGQTITYTLTILNDPATATGPISNSIVTDIFDLSCFDLSSITADIPVGPNNQTPFGFLSLDPLGNFTWFASDDLLPGESASVDISMTVIKPAGFEYIVNTAKIESCILKDDAGNCIGEGSDSDIDVVNESEFPEARHEWGNISSNGIISTSSQEYIKQPSGSLIACAEPFRYEHYREGVLWETITGTLCGNDYASDRTDGLSILDFTPTGDFGNGLSFGFNINNWNIAIHEANGTQCQSCEYISATTIGGQTGSLTLLSSNNGVNHYEYINSHASEGVSSIYDIYESQGINNQGLGNVRTVGGSKATWDRGDVRVVLREAVIPENYCDLYCYNVVLTDIDVGINNPNPNAPHHYVRNDGAEPSTCPELVQIVTNATEYQPDRYAATTNGGNGIIRWFIPNGNIDFTHVNENISKGGDVLALSTLLRKRVVRCLDPFSSEVFVGGQGSINCPVESNNSDNEASSS